MLLQTQNSRTEWHKKEIERTERRGELDIQTDHWHGPQGIELCKERHAHHQSVNMRKHRLWVDAGPFLGDEECSRLARYRMKPEMSCLGEKATSAEPYSLRRIR